MFRKSYLPVFALLFIVIIALAACSQQVEQEPTAVPTSDMTRPASTAEVAPPVAQVQPITLRLAIPDGQGVLYEPSIRHFIEEVQTRSDARILIEPIWDAGADTAAGYEQGVLSAVRDGDYDLGLAASRIWEQEGITALKPLQTPYLIDNDALAIAVAESDIAEEMLDALSASGLAGLTIWPEDLRHPFSVVPGKALLSPDDFGGLTIRTTSMGITAALVEALGGSPELMASTYQGAESGLRQGSTLTGRPTATGNIVFFPKFQVLFANSAAFDRLSEAQRAILLEAAESTQGKAIGDRPSNVDLAATWCADGGSVVLASDPQLAAFVEAAQPVINQIEADPANATVLEALRELKANIQPGPSVSACINTAAQSPPDQVEETWSAGPPPVGVWAVDLTIEDIVRMGVFESNANGWAGSSSYEFRDGGEGLFYGEFLDGGIIKCAFTIEYEEDFFRLAYFDKGFGNYECGDQVDDLQWRLNDEGLHFHVVAIHEGLLLENTAFYEAKPWQQIED